MLFQTSKKTPKKQKKKPQSGEPSRAEPSSVCARVGLHRDGCIVSSIRVRVRVGALEREPCVGYTCPPGSRSSPNLHLVRARSHDEKRVRSPAAGARSEHGAHTAARRWPAVICQRVSKQLLFFEGVFTWMHAGLQHHARCRRIVVQKISTGPELYIVSD